LAGLPAEHAPPLHGVRILDLTRLLPGAAATLLLADLGADVIKIEDPHGGDHARYMPPLVNGTSVYFQVLNRNKRSMTLNLRSPDAARVLDALVAQCDVVIDSFRPRTARRLRVDAETLRSRHPRLVCASITGFGQAGPYVDRAAHDINYEALAGLLTMRPGEAPSVPGLLVADIGSAMSASTGILAALFRRERTGVGGVVDVSIHEAALAWALFPAAHRLVAGAERDARQLPLTGDDACYNVYETADGQWLALGALEPKFWIGFCERIGRPDLGPLQQAQGDERARVLREVRAVMRSRSRDEWLARFADADVCLTRIYTLDEALADPHVAARGLVSRDAGVTYITAPHAEVRRAPALGADTDAVLEAAGISEPERARLRADGVI
jgi:alpha-methylacyl-CoA racemase